MAPKRKAASGTANPRRSKRNSESVETPSVADLQPEDDVVVDEPSLGAAAGISAAPANTDTTRRQGMADIARRRAAHFAHFQAEGGDDDDNIHVGGDQASQLGPWSSARQLVAARAEAAEARKERLLKGNGAQSDDTILWKPTRPNWQNEPRSIRKRVPPLSYLCVKTVADWIHEVESLYGLPQTYLTQLAEAVACRRKLTPEAFALFTDYNPCEVVISNCTQLSEQVMTKGLRACCTYRLEKLDLRFCGRGFGQSAAAAVAEAAPLSALEHLRLSGAYRLTPEHLLEMGKAAPALKRLMLPHCVRLQGPEICALSDLLPGLLELDLTACGGLDTQALVDGLTKFQCLQRLALNEVAGVDNAVVAAAADGGHLRSLQIRRCSAVTDAGIAAVASSSPHLQEIALNEVPITAAAIERLALHCPELAAVAVAGCRRIKSEAALLAMAQPGKLRHVDVGHLDAVTGALLLELACSCKRSLETLNISFCRNVAAKSLGMLLDSCSRLEHVHMYGCSQMTRESVDGHSNGAVALHGEPTFSVVVDGAKALQPPQQSEPSSDDSASGHQSDADTEVEFI